jgi:hypothetical protein
VTRRRCIVTLTDSLGIRHVAEVSADSVFEAAALAVQAFRQSQFSREGRWLGARGVR